METQTKVSDLRRQRAAEFDALNVLADKATLTEEEQTDFTNREAAVRAFDAQIARAVSVQGLAAAGAQPVRDTVAASPENDRYVKERSLVFGGMLRMVGAAGGMLREARAIAAETYGDAHPVTRALVTSTGTAGGMIVPPDYVNEIIELLRAQAVVRAANPRALPMPRGTLTLPGQATAATAAYGAEAARITTSQQTLNQIVATYKKLAAMVPVSNDLMRFSDPAVDAFVRDDLVKVMALAEDAAFLLSMGTADSPMGYLGFANRWVGANGGTPGVWSTTAASTEAVNGTAQPNSTGGNFVTSTYSYTLATVAAELKAAINYLDQANVPETRRVWFMNPRSLNYLFNVQNSLGVYVYRDEMSRGTLLGYPFKKTTQIGTNYHDAAGHSDTSFVFLAEMDESLLLDSMTLELAVSREGSYIDATGATVSAFERDLTLIRAIAEHDFQMRHDQSVSVIQAVAWA